MLITPGSTSIGATVTQIDLGQPVSRTDFAQLLMALTTHKVLCFPKQSIDAPELRDFSACFGSLQTLRSGQDKTGFPEVSVLSNVRREGKLIGIPDAGQNWHTDMTYNRSVGYANALLAFQVPMRDGRTLGATEFCDTAAAYADLPSEFKQQLANATAIHDLNFYWEFMRREKASPRAPLSESERAAHPPSRHPVFLKHPVSGTQSIYVNPSFTTHIEGMSKENSDASLKVLFEHVLKPAYRYTHQWTVGDLLIWDHLSTWHNAIADYGPDEPRLIKRCQIMADRIFTPEFVAAALADQA
ncbi:MAG: TauD/TfdA family dioxygenase [Alcaligenaceae bacterium]